MHVHGIADAGVHGGVGEGRIFEGREKVDVLLAIQGHYRRRSAY